MLRQITPKQVEILPSLSELRRRFTYRNSKLYWSDCPENSYAIRSWRRKNNASETTPAPAGMKPEIKKGTSFYPSYVQLDGKKYEVGRIIVAIQTGVMLDKNVHYLDSDPANLSIENFEYEALSEIGIRCVDKELDQWRIRWAYLDPSNQEFVEESELKIGYSEAAARARMRKEQMISEGHKFKAPVKAGEVPSPNEDEMNKKVLKAVSKTEQKIEELSAKVDAILLALNTMNREERKVANPNNRAKRVREAVEKAAAKYDSTLMN